MPRTGSSFLSDIISNYYTPLITLSEFFAVDEYNGKSFPYELINKTFGIDISEILNFPKSYSNNEIHQNIHKDVRSAYYKITEKQNTLIKIHLAHMFTLRPNGENLSFIADDPNAEFIILNRRYPLTTFYSLKVATKTGSWLVGDSTDVKIILDPTEYKKYILETRILNHYLHELFENKNKNILNLEYYDDLAYENIDHVLNKLNIWFDEINAGLSIKGNVSGLKYVKQNRNNTTPGYLKNCIINYDEIDSIDLSTLKRSDFDTDPPSS